MFKSLNTFFNLIPNTLRTELSNDFFFIHIETFIFVKEIKIFDISDLIRKIGYNISEELD